MIGKKVETTWPWSGSRLAPNPSEHPATYVPAGTFRTVPEHSTSYRNIRHPSYRNMPRPPGTFPELRMHRNILYLAPMGKFIHANSQNWRSFVFESGAASIRNTCYCLAMIIIRIITIIIIITLHQALVIPSISAASFCSLCILSSGRPQGCQPKSLPLPTSGLSTQIRIVGDLKVVNPYLQSQPSGLTTQPT